MQYAGSAANSGKGIEAFVTASCVVCHMTVVRDFL